MTSHDESETIPIHLKLAITKDVKKVKDLLKLAITEDDCLFSAQEL